MARKADGTVTGVPTIVSVVCNWSVNPNSRAAAIAPLGLHRPKITAARAMKPLPDVMLPLNAPEPPMVKIAPPRPASTIPPP